jgi:protein-disulfide isomerase
MQISKTLGRWLAVGLLPVLLGLPLPSAAVAPSAQNLLNLALLNEWNGPGSRADITARIDDLTLHFQNRVSPQPGSLLGNQAGRLSIDSQPVNFLWKLIDRTAYVQIEQLPPNLFSLFQDGSGTDYSVLRGRWITFELGDLGLLIPDDQQADKVKALALRAPPLLVTRVESKTHDANGNEIWRMRLRVNPKFLYGLYALKLSNVKKANAEYAYVRSLLAHTSLVAMVDVTHQTLTRFELGGHYHTAGSSVVTLALGINLSSDDGQIIEAPTDALDTVAVDALLNGSATDTPNLGDTQTLTASGTAPTTVDPSVDHVLGNPSAKVTVITYSDFACPFCQRMDPDLKHLLSDFPLDVRLVYRQFPISSIHPTAQASAEASECAAVQGGNDAFWPMHDKLMASPALQNRDGYLAFADQIGLNRADFATCLDTHAQASRVQRDLDTGQAAGISGTPSSFVNNIPLEGAVGYTMLKNAVVKAGGIH